MRLAKSAGFTRWDGRPLTEEQLDYARKDVEDLLALADELQRRLRERPARVGARGVPAARGDQRRARPRERLPAPAAREPAAPRPRAIARELAAWREATAEAEDRPVGAVLPDVALVEIAKRQPTSLQELERIRGIRPDTGRRRGRQIIEAVARGRDAEPPPAEDVQRTEIDARDAPVISLAESLVRSRALGAGLAYELVASRRRPSGDRQRGPRGPARARRAHPARLAPRPRRRRSCSSSWRGARAWPAPQQSKPRRRRAGRTACYWCRGSARRAPCRKSFQRRDLASGLGCQQRWLGVDAGLFLLP